MGNADVFHLGHFALKSLPSSDLRDVVRGPKLRNLLDMGYNLGAGLFRTAHKTEIGDLRSAGSAGSETRAERLNGFSGS